LRYSKRPRRGDEYFTYEQFSAIRENLPGHLKPVVDFAYNTGWRRGEIINLTWDRVNLPDGVITLPRLSTKNKKPRKLIMNSEDVRIIRSQWSQRRLGCPYVFHCDGKKIRDFRRSWKKACKKAGLPGAYFHSFRRTAALEMDEAGMSRSQIRRRAGWETDSMFYLYNIGTEDGERRAAELLSEYRQRNRQSG
jgi:integrase